MSDESGFDQPAIFERPTGWRRIYYHPILQVALLGFVCFMCPGMFNALTGLGGGGQVNTTDQANANSALYATFAFFSFFSGCVGGAALGCAWMVTHGLLKFDQQPPWAAGDAHVGNMGIFVVYRFLLVRFPFYFCSRRLHS